MSELRIGAEDSAPGGCPTCSHTMECLYLLAYHCPRCGTVTVKRLGGMDVYRPKLVDRCREFFTDEAPSAIAPSIFRLVSEAMRQAGITESLWRPEDRP